MYFLLEHYIFQPLSGSVLYCLDKNYGGFLIIWDRLFGTFQEEKEKQEVIYGLVKNQPSFNPLFLQVCFLYISNLYSRDGQDS